ncbi:MULTISPECIES: hypothetical protein [unclassified Pseudodesulfovibrio]|uniref:hypothetical protein n=1 Tax=unclassified Pseudodesulfovibrio TaxID=2661612 RepID=UPI000FEB6EDE|nr:MULTISPECIES: hypothetical protein [unclassified Pseudodesulfovibrio]MCJ2163437.1 hypothetical protein [Pseudodesulfovibrio sp. S3-i]RWU06673.1 hypothetical protein DWB63_02605 [Pseudodesulfovibrio sp. S3]
MQHTSRLVLYPSRLYLLALLGLNLLLLGSAWYWLSRRVAEPTFFEANPDVVALLLIPVILAVLPWIAFYLRRLLMQGPSIFADHIGLYVDCNLLGQTFLPWFFINSLEPQEFRFSHCLMVELNPKGMDRLGFWRRFLLSVGIGGYDNKICLPESMYPDDPQTLCNELQTFFDCPFAC